MKKTILCIAFSVFLTGLSAICYSQQWQQKLTYTIDVSLNDTEHTLDGKESIEYTNNSPDTLHFIWFHLWANAYKNDKTAYSEYLLDHDRTDFYFSNRDQKGYINRLDFKVNGITARMEDHPNYIDIIKLLLPEPLPPGSKAIITTPFHVQLPYNFSGNGFNKHRYVIAQWCPVPAVYDTGGWHAMPFTNQVNGGEPGEYTVLVKVPENFMVTSGNNVYIKTAGEPYIKLGQSAAYNFKWSAASMDSIPKATVNIQKKHQPFLKKPVQKKTVQKKLVQKKPVDTITKKNNGSMINKLLFDTTRTSPISILPAIGYNRYDGLMIGAIIHNYRSEQKKLRFLAIPLYGTASSKLNGLARVSYYKDFQQGIFKKAEITLAASHFSKNRSMDTNRVKSVESFTKITPSIRLHLTDDSSGRHEKWIGFKSFLIVESNFQNYTTKTDDGLIYSYGPKSSFRYVNELSFYEQKRRALYPYDYKVQVQQGKAFYRINLTGNYFLNYSKGGGASVRIFAAKFGYLDRSFNPDFNITNYMPKLLANNGEEDYTYSDYFIGRTASDYQGIAIKNGGLAAQQVMLRDGGFKIRTDQLTQLEGKSDNWVVALNLTTTLPYKIFPPKLPVKLYLDLGTQAENWKSDSEADRFVFDAGVQLSLFKNSLTIYVPVVYSKIYKEYFQSFSENKFLKTITFSLNFQNIIPQKLASEIKPW